MNNSDKIGREVNDSLANLEDNDVECMNTNTLEDSTSLGKVDNIIHQSVTVSAAPRPVTENGGSVDDTNKTTSTRKQAEEIGKTGKNEEIVNVETTKEPVKELSDDGRSIEPDVETTVTSEDTSEEERVVDSEISKEKKAGKNVEIKEDVKELTKENFEEMDDTGNKELVRMTKVTGNDYPELSALGIKADAGEVTKGAQAGTAEGGAESPKTETGTTPKELGEEENFEKWVKCLFWQTNENSDSCCLTAKNVQVELGNSESAISSKLVLERKMRVITRRGEPDKVNLWGVFAEEVETVPKSETLLEFTVICDDDQKIVLGAPDYIKLLLGSQNAEKEETKLIIQEPMQGLVRQMRSISEVKSIGKLDVEKFGLYQLAAIRVALAHTEANIKKRRNYSKEEKDLVDCIQKIVRKLVRVISQLVAEEEVWDKVCQYPEVFETLVVLSLHQVEQEKKQDSFLDEDQKQKGKG